MHVSKRDSWYYITKALEITSCPMASPFDTAMFPRPVLKTDSSEYKIIIVETSCMFKLPRVMCLKPLHAHCTAPHTCTRQSSAYLSLCVVVISFVLTGRSLPWLLQSRVDKIGISRPRFWPCSGSYNGRSILHPPGLCTTRNVPFSPGTCL